MKGDLFNTSPPHTAPALVRRSSISSESSSWDSSRDSLPSTPGYHSNYGTPARQNSPQTSFTDSLLMDSDENDNYLMLAGLTNSPRNAILPRPTSEDYSSYLRKDTNLGGDRSNRHAYPYMVDSPDLYSSESVGYDSSAFPSPNPNVFEYQPTPAPCNDASYNALRLCYYSSAPSSPQSRSSRGVCLTSSSVRKSTKGAVRLPLIVTSDEKPHVCPKPECSMRFKRQEHLRRHERTHTSERPYSCEICNKKFSRTDNLKSHRKTHMKKTGRNQYIPGLNE